MDRRYIDIDNKILEIVVGDITNQPDIEAIVNSANKDLKPGGGVSGAIHRKAGPELYEYAKSLAPIKVSQAVITPAFRLPNKYVIHTLGPVYGLDKPEDKLLQQTYMNCIKLADEYKVKSLAFPSISTGIFGYPIELAAPLAVESIIQGLKETNLSLVRIVLYTFEDYRVYEGVVAQKDRALPS